MQFLLVCTRVPGPTIKPAPIIEKQGQHAVGADHQCIGRQDPVALLRGMQFAVARHGDGAAHVVDDADPLDRQAERQKPRLDGGIDSGRRRCRKHRRCRARPDLIRDLLPRP